MKYYTTGHDMVLFFQRFLAEKGCPSPHRYRSPSPAPFSARRGAGRRPGKYPYDHRVQRMFSVSGRNDDRGPRSELIARALREHLERHDQDRITAQLDAMCADVDTRLEPDLARFGHQILEGNEW